MFKYGNQNYWVEKTIIAFFIIWGMATIYTYCLLYTSDAADD